MPFHRFHHNPRWFDFEDLTEHPGDDTHTNLKRTRPFYNVSDIAGVLTHNFATRNHTLVHMLRGQRPVYGTTVRTTR